MNIPQSNLETELEVRYQIESNDDLIVFGDNAELNSDTSLSEIFEFQAKLNPDAIALVCNQKKFSYRELNNRSEQLALYLRQNYSLIDNSLIGIKFNKSELPIIVILGCLKAGFGYVPLDPSYPVDRIKFIISEASISLVITENDFVPKLKELEIDHVLDFQTEQKKIYSQNIENTLPKVPGKNIAYVIYTSGTTGNPKGVVTSHNSVVRFVLAFNKACRTKVGEKVLQGFSLCFDGSIEEIWMAFSNGSILVMPDKDTPKFGNDLAQFMIDQNITYFSSVPTMLSTMTIDIPCLKILVLSGEMCPKELVSRWAKNTDRLMLNVYGPTEATVNTTSFRCLPDKEITIGTPLAGYHVYILDEHKKEVPKGEKGEIYVGSKTLALGYLNQKELTEKQFISIEPSKEIPFARLYRTGDLGRINEEGEIELFGRADLQVKIRGFRVELSEIENLLMAQSNIALAIVKVHKRDGVNELAAYVENENHTLEMDMKGIVKTLTDHLPPYMMPTYLDVVSSFPRLNSGKVDRKKIPDPINFFNQSTKDFVEAKSEIEVNIANSWKVVLSLKEVSIESDFFQLGGHSLLVAQFVTSLREKYQYEISVKEAYKYPTIKQLAEHIERKLKKSQENAHQTKERVPTSKEVYESLSWFTKLMVPTLQIFSILIFMGFGTLPFFILLYVVMGYLESELTLAFSLGVLFLTGTALWPLWMAFGILSKWVIIGRYKPGKYPVWGFYYFRWWLVSKLHGASGLGVFAGTPLAGWYFKVMGAKIGKNCTFDSMDNSIFDLLTVGDESSLGSDSQFLGYKIEDGMLHLGTVEIGKRCFVGIHSCLSINSKMKDRSLLDDQSMVPENFTLEANESYKGSPCEKDFINLYIPPEDQPAYKAPYWTTVVQLFWAALASWIIGMLGWVYLAAIISVFYFGGLGWLAFCLVVSVPVSIVLYCYIFAGVKHLILPIRRSKPGIYSLESRFFIRKWLSDSMMSSSQSVMLPLYTTMYFPSWLRLLGAKIGKRAELSTVSAFTPELVDIGPESFFADGSIIGGRRTYRGMFEIGINKIGKRSFVGNNAMLPIGRGLGDNCLLGVNSTLPGKEPVIANGSEWLGSKAFSLPNRPVVGNFQSDVTFNPTRKLWIQRAIIDGLRILIPGYIGLFNFLLGIYLIYLCVVQLSVGWVFLYAPLIGFSLSISTIAFVCILKKVIMGTFKPEIKPLWSMYVWLNEMINGIYESVMTPLITPFLGTPFASIFLRWIGCTIGKRVLIQSALFSEFDLVKIGDYSSLGIDSIIQTHLFEDRIMKSSYSIIEPECSVGNMSVVLYDTVMKKGSSLRGMSLLMKGESLEPNTKWEGIPCSPV